MNREELISKFLRSPTTTKSTWILEAMDDLTDFLSKEHDPSTEGLAFMVSIAKYIPIERLEQMIK